MKYTKDSKKRKSQVEERVGQIMWINNKQYVVYGWMTGGCCNVRPVGVADQDEVDRFGSKSCFVSYYSIPYSTFSDFFDEDLPLLNK